MFLNFFLNYTPGCCHKNLTIDAMEAMEAMSRDKAMETMLMLQKKLSVLQELVKKKPDEAAAPAEEAPAEAAPAVAKRQRQTVNGGGGKRRKKRKKTSTKKKKIRSSFKRLFMEKVDARYLAPQFAYKMYKQGARGETVQTAKFIKIVGPILKQVLGESDDEDECIKQVPMTTSRSPLFSPASICPI